MPVEDPTIEWVSAASPFVKIRSRPDMKTFLVRYFGAIVSGLMLGLGYFMALSDPKFQTLHDRIAGTIVVKD